MASVSINPPQTPVTKGSMSFAKATLPNMCKMPGPPAPFVPTPLPNIGRSSDTPKGYSTTVKIEGNTVAIRGASFNSIGDIASKALGGGLVSMNTHGPTTFIGLGSLDVQIEGKNVQLLSDPMMNNNGPTGSPPNSATLGGVKHRSGQKKKAKKVDCAKLKAKWGVESGTHKENTSPGPNKKSSKSPPYQSHHIFQDALMPAELCPRAAAQAVMLFNSATGTEHQTINKAQAGRNTSKSASSFGQLKKDAQKDLEKALEGRRGKNGKKGLSKKEAKQLAKCLVTEAEKVAKKAAKDRGEELNDDTMMDPPEGCFPAGTLLQLASGALCAVEELSQGDHLKTLLGEEEIVRLEQCRHSLVELGVGGELLRIASYHRLFSARGEPVRAERLRVGDKLAGARGVVIVESWRLIEGTFPLYRVGLSHAGSCLLGHEGVVAELPYLGPPLVGREVVEPFAPGAP